MSLTEEGLQYAIGRAKSFNNRVNKLFNCLSIQLIDKVQMDHWGGLYLFGISINENNTDDELIKIIQEMPEKSWNGNIDFYGRWMEPIEVKQDFDYLVKKIVSENGISILSESKTFKSIFLNYYKEEFRNSMEYFCKIIDLGAYNIILNADDLNKEKSSLVKRLHEEYLIHKMIGEIFIEKYTSIIRKDNVKNYSGIEKK
ncbi:MAG: hypothetical protein FWD47_04560 [Treponema sp.]|nr:hypothetical protein [Treponema sp.]